MCYNYIIKCYFLAISVTKCLTTTERLSYVFPQQIRFLSSAAESRQWLTGTKEFPSGPAQGKHSEHGSVFHEAVVKDSGKQFHLFGTGTVKQDVVNDEDILSFFAGQQFYKTVDDAGGKLSCEALPVRSGIVQETVEGVLRESFFKGVCLHLHIDAPVREHHAKKVMKNVHDRNAFIFPGIAFEKQSAKVESLYKFCGKIRNTVFIIGCLWYT